MVFADHVDVVVAPLAVRSAWLVVGVDHFDVPHFAAALHPLEDGFGVVGVAGPGTVTLAVDCTAPAAHALVECDDEFGVGFVLFWCAIVFDFHCYLLLGGVIGGEPTLPIEYCVSYLLGRLLWVHSCHLAFFRKCFYFFLVYSVDAAGVASVLELIA